MLDQYRVAHLYNLLIDIDSEELVVETYLGGGNNLQGKKLTLSNTRNPSSFLINTKRSISLDEFLDPSDEIAAHPWGVIYQIYTKGVAEESLAVYQQWLNSGYFYFLISFGILDNPGSMDRYAQIQETPFQEREEKLMTLYITNPPIVKKNIKEIEQICTQESIPLIYDKPTLF